MDEQVRLVIEEREAFHDWISTRTDDSCACILCESRCAVDEVVCRDCIASGAGNRLQYGSR